MSEPTISDEMVNVFLRAAVAAGAGAYISGGQGRLEVEDEQVRAGLTAALVASGYRREADVLREAADTLEAGYPETVWLPESTSPDAMAAKGVRAACNRLRHMATERATALEPSLPLPEVVERSPVLSDNSTEEQA